MSEWMERIEKLFRVTNREYYTASEMRGHLSLDRQERVAFKSVLDDLVDRGILEKDARKRYRLTQSPKKSHRPSPQASAEDEEGFEPRRPVATRRPGKVRPDLKPKKGTLFLKANRWWVKDDIDQMKRYPVVGNRPGLQSGEAVQYALAPSEGRFDEVARLIGSNKFETFREVADQFLKRLMVPTGYPPKAIAEVGQRKSPDLEGFEGRLDLRHLEVLCIDPLGARDHDDAISLIPGAKAGDWQLGVHIADVSHYVEDDSDLDREAVARAFTQYLPWEAHPMLPEVLSSGWCSLVEGEDRYAFSCLIELKPDGSVRSFEFVKSVVKVTRSITYEEAQAAEGEGDPAMVEFAKVCGLLKAQRSKSGILLLDMPESKVVFDENNNPIKIDQRKNIPSMNWIEECMLLANQCCAKFCTKNKLHGLYRTHEPPPREDIQDLAQTEPDLFRGHSVRQIVERDEPEGHGRNVDPVRFDLYRKLVESARGDAVLMRKILRSMSKARYSAESEGHFALNWADYSHFTSPIRRYADLWVHRQMSAFLAGHRIKGQDERIMEIADRISEREIVIMKTERQALKLCAAWIMKDSLGETFDAVISGMESFGMFVEIPSTGAEGLLRYQDMDGDYYQLSEDGESLVGRRSRRVFRRGDSMRVILSRVDLENGQLDFVMAEDVERAEAAAPSPKALRAEIGIRTPKNSEQTEEKPRRRSGDFEAPEPISLTRRTPFSEDPDFESAFGSEVEERIVVPRIPRVGRDTEAWPGKRWVDPAYSERKPAPESKGRGRSKTPENEISAAPDRSLKRKTMKLGSGNISADAKDLRDVWLDSGKPKTGSKAGAKSSAPSGDKSSGSAKSRTSYTATERGESRGSSESRGSAGSSRPPRGSRTTAAEPSDGFISKRRESSALAEAIRAEKEAAQAKKRAKRNARGPAKAPPKPKRKPRA
jgi:ribonuclease R